MAPNDWLNIESYCEADDCDDDGSIYNRMCDTAKPDEFYYAVVQRPSAPVCIYFCPAAYFDVHKRFPDAFIHLDALLANSGYRKYPYDELPLAITNDPEEVVHAKLKRLGFRYSETFDEFCKETDE